METINTFFNRPTSNSNIDDAYRFVYDDYHLRYMYRLFSSDEIINANIDFNLSSDTLSVINHNILTSNLSILAYKKIDDGDDNDDNDKYSLSVYEMSYDDTTNSYKDKTFSTKKTFDSFSLLTAFCNSILTDIQTTARPSAQNEILANLSSDIILSLVPMHMSYYNSDHIVDINLSSSVFSSAIKTIEDLLDLNAAETADRYHPIRLYSQQSLNTNTSFELVKFPAKVNLQTMDKPLSPASFERDDYLVDEFINNINPDRWLTDAENQHIRDFDNNQPLDNKIGTDILEPLKTMFLINIDNPTVSIISVLSKIISQFYGTILTPENIRAILIELAAYLSNVKILNLQCFLKVNEFDSLLNKHDFNGLFPELPMNSETFSDTKLGNFYSSILMGPLITYQNQKASNRLDNEIKNTHFVEDLVMSSNFVRIYSRSLEQQINNITNDILVYTPLYTTSVADYPTFDVKSPTGSNGIFKYFKNVTTNTIDFSSYVDELIERYQIFSGNIISKKSVGLAIINLIELWHENIQSIQYDFYCCHYNCHANNLDSITKAKRDIIFYPITVSTEKDNLTIVQQIFNESITLVTLTNTHMTFQSTKKLYTPVETYKPSADRLDIIPISYPIYTGTTQSNIELSAVCVISNILGPDGSKYDGVDSIVIPIKGSRQIGSQHVDTLAHQLFFNMEDHSSDSPDKYDSTSTTNFISWYSEKCSNKEIWLSEDAADYNMTLSCVGDVTIRFKSNVTIPHMEIPDTAVVFDPIPDGYIYFDYSKPSEYSEADYQNYLGIQMINRKLAGEAEPRTFALSYRPQPGLSAYYNDQFIQLIPANSYYSAPYNTDYKFLWQNFDTLQSDKIPTLTIRSTDSNPIQGVFTVQYHIKALPKLSLSNANSGSAPQALKITWDTDTSAGDLSPEYGIYYEKGTQWTPPVLVQEFTGNYTEDEHHTPIYATINPDLYEVQYGPNTVVADGIRATITPKVFEQTGNSYFEGSYRLDAVLRVDPRNASSTFAINFDDLVTLGGPYEAAMRWDNSGDDEDTGEDNEAYEDFIEEYLFQDNGEIQYGEKVLVVGEFTISRWYKNPWEMKGGADRNRVSGSLALCLRLSSGQLVTVASTSYSWKCAKDYDTEKTYYLMTTVSRDDIQNKRVVSVGAYSQVFQPKIETRRNVSVVYKVSGLKVGDQFVIMAHTIKGTVTLGSLSRSADTSFTTTSFVVNPSNKSLTYHSIPCKAISHGLYLAPTSMTVNTFEYIYNGSSTTIGSPSGGIKFSNPDVSVFSTADNVALKSKSTVSFTLADGAINPENKPAARQLNTSIPDSVYYTDATASKKVSFSYAGITLNVTSWGPCSTSGYGDYYVSRLPSIEMACIKTMTHADYIKLIQIPRTLATAVKDAKHTKTRYATYIEFVSATLTKSGGSTSTITFDSEIGNMLKYNKEEDKTALAGIGTTVMDFKNPSGKKTIFSKTQGEEFEGIRSQIVNAINACGGAGNVTGINIALTPRYYSTTPTSPSKWVSIEIKYYYTSTTVQNCTTVNVKYNSTYSDVLAQLSSATATYAASHSKLKTIDEMNYCEVMKESTDEEGNPVMIRDPDAPENLRYHFTLTSGRNNTQISAGSQIPAGLEIASGQTFTADSTTIYVIRVV